MQLPHLIIGPDHLVFVSHQMGRTEEALADPGEIVKSLAGVVGMKSASHSLEGGQQNGGASPLFPSMTMVAADSRFWNRPAGVQDFAAHAGFDLCVEDLRITTSSRAYCGRE